jgi:ribonuclease HI
MTIFRSDVAGMPPDAEAGERSPTAPVMGADPPEIALQVFSDGCYEPRDDTGGWSFVVCRDGLEVAAECGRVLKCSNNAMELVALLKAASWLDANAPGEPAVLWSDSAYAVTGCNRWRPIWKNWGWRKRSAGSRTRSRPIPDAELWMAVDAVLSMSPNIAIAWCKGHAGIAGNERADALAERGRQGADPAGWTAAGGHGRTSPHGPA